MPRLVGARCWLAAYNRGATYWGVNSRPPYAPQAAAADANTYDKRKLVSEQKGRGLGDCSSMAESTCDGTTFVQCRLGYRHMPADRSRRRLALAPLVTTVTPIR